LISAFDDLAWLATFPSSGMQLPSLETVHFRTDFILMG
jgi:hypothetical protein